MRERGFRFEGSRSFRAEYRVVLGAGALVLVALGIWMSRSRIVRVSQDASSALPIERASQPEREPVDDPLSALELDSRRTIAPAESPSSVEGRTSHFRVRGRVLDVFGTGVAGVDLHFRGNTERTLGRSGAGGVFELTLEEPPTNFVLDAEDDNWAAVRTATVDVTDPTPAEALLVVAPAVELAGVVVTQSGGEVSAARLTLPLYTELLAACPVPLDSTLSADVQTETDARGRFRLGHAPGIAGSYLSVNAPGFQTEYVRLDGRGNSQIVVTLRVDEHESRSIEGIVLHSGGTPAESARVNLWDRSTSTDAHGRFRFDRPNWLPDEAALIASREGF